MSEKLSSVKIKKSTLNAAFRSLGAAVRKQKKFYKDLTVIELTVTNGLLTLAVPGSIVSKQCTTVGTCKATLRYNYFFQLIEDCTHKLISIEIKEGEININGVRKIVNTTFFENDSILRTINLPVNYRDIDLLRMPHEGFTIEELRFNLLALPLMKAEKKLKDNIEMAYSKLFEYGVTEEDIIELVEKRGRIKINLENG